jgi:uncharacterized protein YuzE
MKVSFDNKTGVAYVEVREGLVDRTERLDQDRVVDYDAQGRVMGYEFLNARRRGVDLRDLPDREELTRLFERESVKVFA